MNRLRRGLVALVAAQSATFLAQDKAPDMNQVMGIYERSPYSLVVNPA